MDFNFYQQQLARMSAANPKDMTREDRLGLALSLTGHSGEAADRIKKVEVYGHPLLANALEEKLGDVLWHLAAIATAYGLELDGVAATNIGKIKADAPGGLDALVAEVEQLRRDNQRLRGAIEAHRLSAIGLGTDSDHRLWKNADA